MSVDPVRERVWRVIVAGRRIQNPADELGQKARALLPGETGLAKETVELVLREHFETFPADAEIDALLKSVQAAPVCHVILSANVCTAPLRALALAVATAERVKVRPSRRDPVVTELLVQALREDSEFVGEIEVVETIRPEPLHELHLYGSDETIAMLTANLPAGVIVRGHGTGLGLAVVGAAVDFEQAAEGLARDTIAFDQRGCLSPRFVFVEGDVLRAERFAEALHAALGRLGEQYPRGIVDEAEVAQYRATMQAIGSYWSGMGHAVGLDPAPRALVLPPTARILHLIAVDAERIEPLLVSWIRHVTAVGSNDEGALTRAIRLLVPNARFSRLGWMQRPLLDGPVDGRSSF